MNVIEPGGTIGVLGSGQLGRMFTFSAKRMGYRVHVFSPEQDSPAGQVADLEIVAAYDDMDAVEDFARAVDVATLEFENIPIRTMEVVERLTPIRPGPNVLHTTQNRLREKSFLDGLGLPVPKFQAVRSLEDLQAASRQSLPAVLKTASWGYDGKGQTIVQSASDVAKAWATLSSDEAILEELIDFQCELSVVAARGSDGQLACYAPFLNRHRNHILDVSISPSGLPSAVTRDAVEIARHILVELEVIGVLCVELFLQGDGRLLINELAPRPHNSGHLTMDAHVTSQFDQQVLAVCGLPLGSTLQLRPAAMVNILGEAWENGKPSWKQCVANSAAVLHLYGKRHPLPGRKMGHITSLADSAHLAAQQAMLARDSLGPKPVPSQPLEQAVFN